MFSQSTAIFLENNKLIKNQPTEMVIICEISILVGWFFTNLYKSKNYNQLAIMKPE